MADLARRAVTIGWLDGLAIAIRLDREQRRGNRWNTYLSLASVVVGAAITLAIGPFGLVSGVVFYFVVRALLFRALARRGDRLLASYTEAFHARDLDVVRRFHRLFAAQHGRGREARALVDYDVASELILEERWAEARDRLRGIDPEVFLQESGRVMLLNNLAFVTALAGDGAEGVSLARDADMRASVLASVHELAPEYLDFVRGTLGTALTRAGEHEEAIDVLRPLVDAPAQPSVLAIRAFHLGESLRALGDHAGAAAAYERAEEDAGGPWAERAKDARLRLSPHR